MFVLPRLKEDGGRLTRRIRNILAGRHAMHIGELRMRLGVDRTSMLEELESMMARGEIERLRPVDYAGDEHDFFRVKRPAFTPARVEPRWAPADANEGRELVGLAGEAMACVAD